MGVVISLIVVFIISFLLIFKLVYSGNKEESESDKLNFPSVVFVGCLLALLPTAAIAFIIFVLLGSTSAVNVIFSLEISRNQLIILAISLFIYLFSIDSIIEIIVEYIVGKNNTFYFSILLLIRIVAFYLIGFFIGLSQSNSFTMAVGITVIIFLIEVFYHLREKNKEKDLRE